MNFTFKKLEIFVIVVIIAGIGIVYAFKQRPVVVVTNSPVTSSDDSAPNTSTSIRPEGSLPTPAAEVPGTVITYPGVDGKNALDLLKANHQVVAKHYDFGDMVTSIDGVAPDSKHFWAFYVNDQFSQVGASAYVTKSSDTIKWQVDAVVDTTK